MILLDGVRELCVLSYSDERLQRHPASVTAILVTLLTHEQLLKGANEIVTAANIC